MSAFLYVSLAMGVLLFELCRKKEHVFDFMLFFNFFFVNSFAIIPFLLIMYGEHAPISSSYFSGLELIGRVETPLLVIEGYVFFLLGFYLSKRENVCGRFHVQVTISDKNIYLLLVLSFVIFYASLYLYTAQFGGLIQTILMAELIRDGVIEGGELEFVKHFMKISVITLLFTFYMIFHSPNVKKRSVYKLFFYVCILNFLIHFLLINSRGFVVVTLLSMYALTCLINRKYYFFRMSWGGVFVLLVILFGNVFFASIGTLIMEGWDPFVREFSQRQEHETRNVAASILKNFVHPILSLELSLQEKIDYRYFIDFPISIATLVPERLTGIQLPPSISVLNTYLHHGVYKSTIPPGIYGLFYYSMGVVGVFIGMFAYGFIGGGLQKIMSNSMRNKKNGMIVFYFLIAYAFGAFVDSGEPSAYVISNFMLMIVLALVILFFSRIYRINYRKNCL